MRSAESAKTPHTKGKGEKHTKNNIISTARGPPTMGRKGGNAKKSQKHQNRVAYKAAKYGESKRMKEVRTAQTSNVCPRCYEKIEWRKQFGKYKPRTTLGRCNLCHEKAVKIAYHTVCGPCAKKNDVCAKCGKREEDIVPEGPSKDELLKQETDEQRMLFNMRERERRTYFRQQEQAMREEEQAARARRRAEAEAQAQAEAESGADEVGDLGTIEEEEGTEGGANEDGDDDHLASDLQSKAVVADGGDQDVAEDDGDSDWEDIDDDDDGDGDDDDDDDDDDEADLFD
ncbi:hypothetical protein PTSG_03114 [Salpingoeca rosetta]|uniref:Uncharacterized protein n=1 Tax=Salpingoeca rosetta (strain ATCC 50818 / BSB-021) TaxID=946362 RepID=F2U498_SALR5|nr:uncharacterized protein PTSG_03114 [Salpingoeca rosetta]EGD82464.1 hypothetical protein PTSG_03114 [Salpingoeca rosetta]|eukprot:XP_004995700.1 hypothetical protein PTSG_03114 [Salpingoeca rosetta]